MATHSSILAWEIFWTEKPGGLQSMDTQKIWTQISKWTAATNAFPRLLTTWLTLGKLFQEGITHQSFFPPGIELLYISSAQFSSVTQPCLTHCDPMNGSTPGLPAHHQLPEFTQTHVHRVGDAIQLSYPLPSPFPPTPNPSQHQSLFQWVNSSQEVAKGLEFQL